MGHRCGRMADIPRIITNGYVELRALTEAGEASLQRYGAVRRVMQFRNQIGQMMRKDWRLYGVRGPYIEVCSTQGTWGQEYISLHHDPDLEIVSAWGQTDKY